ncbi:hypothetical protein [Cellulosimicrobium funkei]|uniref:hypothetical protein n=1 Tax=Cellulosimicrobium funkei TaxID=264251 RepID=UPI0037DD6B24
MRKGRAPADTGRREGGGAEVHEPYLVESLVAGYGAGVLETDLGSDVGLEPLDRWVGTTQAC